MLTELQYVHVKITHSTCCIRQNPACRSRHINGHWSKIRITKVRGWKTRRDYCRFKVMCKKEQQTHTLTSAFRPLVFFIVAWWQSVCVSFIASFLENPHHGIQSVAALLSTTGNTNSFFPSFKLPSGDSTDETDPPTPLRHMANQFCLFCAKVTLYLRREDRRATIMPPALTLYPNESSW